MAVMSVRNQYRGVNAHLHSFWQATGSWNRFHNVYIAYMRRALRQHLFPMGYVAEIEDSLQIRSPGFELPRIRKPDVVIYDTDVQRTAHPAMPSTAELTIEQVLYIEDADTPYTALALYPVLPNGDLGDVVAWIELLSPSNKGGEQDAMVYAAKRRTLLESGLVFVEIDYLHETPSTFLKIADYTQGHADAHPYRILVLNPRPNIRKGGAVVREFDVDDPIPTLTIPLNGNDILPFDFGATYQAMFIEDSYGFGLDYAALPLHFERYSPADQARIARRMLAVLQAAHAGHNLEDGPFPVSTVALDEALHQIDTLRKLLA